LHYIQRHQVCACIVHSHSNASTTGLRVIEAFRCRFSAPLPYHSLHLFLFFSSFLRCTVGTTPRTKLSIGFETKSPISFLSCTG
jgi:hypothetical protein